MKCLHGAKTVKQKSCLKQNSAHSVGRMKADTHVVLVQTSTTQAFQSRIRAHGQVSCETSLTIEHHFGASSNVERILLVNNPRATALAGRSKEAKWKEQGRKRKGGGACDVKMTHSLSSSVWIGVNWKSTLVPCVCFSCPCLLALFTVSLPCCI